MTSFLSLKSLILYNLIQTFSYRKPASVAYAAAVNPSGIKTLAVNGLSAFPIEGIPVFSNGPKGLSKNPPDFPILCN